MGRGRVANDGNRVPIQFGSTSHYPGRTCTKGVYCPLGGFPPFCPLSTRGETVTDFSYGPDKERDALNGAFRRWLRKVSVRAERNWLDRENDWLFARNQQLAAALLEIARHGDEHNGEISRKGAPPESWAARKAQEAINTTVVKEPPSRLEQWRQEAMGDV